MRYKRTVLLAVMAGTFLTACANDETPVEAEPKILDQTFFPPPVRQAQLVDWTTAGFQNDADNPASNFRRASFLMATLANAAYNSDDSFRQTAESLGFVFTSSVHSETGTFNQTDADAVLGASSDGTMNFIAIRGSHELSDYAIDAFVVPTASFENGGAPITLHQGISQYAEAVYSGLRDQLGSSCDAESKTPLWITGHSLGAAAASVVAYQLAREGCDVAGVSLFGTLRSGLSDWQSAYDQAATPIGPLPYMTTRWVHKNDPMYCLPVGGAWKHVGFEAHIDSGVSVSSNETVTQCDSAEGWIGGLKTALQISDLPTNIAVGVQRAISDWLANLIQISLFCSDDTKWDDLWSLGACTVVNSGNDFVQTYGVTPSEFLGEVVNLVVAGDHKPERYAQALTADFGQPDTRPIINLHLMLQIQLNDFFASTQISDAYSHVWCTPELDGNGQPFCDIPVRLGNSVRLETGGYDKQLGYLAGDCPHPLFNTGAEDDSVCDFVPDQDTNISFHFVAALQ